jgi:hypothetical protein
LLFIKYAKSFAINKTEHYLSLNNFASIKSSIQIIITAFIEVLTFKRKEIFVSVYTYLVITFLITLFIHILKKKLFLKLFSNKWVSFFIADFISIFITFLMSSWVLANGMGRWYFVASYISLSVAIVLIIESIEVTKIFRYYLLLIIVIGAISPVYNMKYISPKRLRPMVDVVGEFKQLGKIGILAEFWNSYIASCSDPEMIKATPNDKSGIRNQKLVDEVFERKNIYVIKDMWLDFFPDTLEQFGYVLLKQGKQFRLGDCDVCKYEKIKKNKSYSVVDFKHKDNQIIFDYPYKKNVLSASYSCDTCKEKYLIYGPYIPLGIGDFKVRFCIKVNNPQNENSIALLDVSANWGNNQLANKRITKTDLTDNSYNYFDLYFKTTQRVNGVEFRIYYYGNANLYFDHLELLEK